MEKVVQKSGESVEVIQKAFNNTIAVDIKALLETKLLQVFPSNHKMLILKFQRNLNL
mgnify:CR=1 FL=1